MVDGIRDYFTASQAYKPSVAPDGDRVAFITDESGVPEAWIVDLAENRRKRITDSEHDTTFALWSSTR